MPHHRYICPIMDLKQWWHLLPTSRTQRILTLSQWCVITILITICRPFSTKNLRNVLQMLGTIEYKYYCTFCKGNILYEDMLLNENIISKHILSITAYYQRIPCIRTMSVRNILILRTRNTLYLHRSSLKTIKLKLTFYVHSKRYG